MYNINDELRLNSINGMTYKIVIVNINEFRPPEAKYGIDMWDGNGIYAGDVQFVGESFLNICEKIIK